MSLDELRQHVNERGHTCLKHNLIPPPLSRRSARDGVRSAIAAEQTVESSVENRVTRLDIAMRQLAEVSV